LRVLDEICACPADIQPALLRLIEAREVLLDGAGTPIKVDLKIISATNEDTAIAVDEGRLRRDLLFRLEGFVLSIPPLKARLDDVSLLAQHFISRAASVHGAPPPEMTDADISILMAHDWPGNVRELRNVVERFVILAQHGQGTMATALDASDAAPLKSGLREAVAAFERQMISKAIQTNNGRMDDAADTLGIGRRTLNEKIVKLGLDKDALL